MIDTHTHLDQIPSDDHARILERAAAAGVERIVSVGMDPTTSEAAVALANRDSRVYAAVGIHPWHAAEHSSTNAVASLEQLTRDRRVVAIGEIGLDYEGNIFTGDSYRGDAARTVQREVLRRQLRLAGARNLPVIVHARGGAHQDVGVMLAEAGLEARAVIQLLSGTNEEDIHAYVSQGCYLSVGGVATDPRETALRHAIRAIPLDRLVLETDAPYVAPVWKGGSPSEPADLLSIASYVAALIDRPFTDLVAAATANACTFYRLSDTSH